MVRVLTPPSEGMSEPKIFIYEGGVRTGKNPSMGEVSEPKTSIYGGGVVRHLSELSREFV